MLKFQQIHNCFIIFLKKWSKSVYFEHQFASHICELIVVFIIWKLMFKNSIQVASLNVWRAQTASRMIATNSTPSDFHTFCWRSEKSQICIHLNGRIALSTVRHSGLLEVLECLQEASGNLARPQIKQELTACYSYQKKLSQCSLGLHQ